MPYSSLLHFLRQLSLENDIGISVSCLQAGTSPKRDSLLKRRPGSPPERRFFAYYQVFL